MGKNKSLFGEFLAFLGEKKRWWLIPIAVLLFLVGIIITLAQSSAISPFIYALF